jgi:hypothetical protein
MWMTSGRRFHVNYLSLLRFLSCLLSWTSPRSFTLDGSWCLGRWLPCTSRTVVFSLPRLRGCFLTFLYYIGRWGRPWHRGLTIQRSFLLMRETCWMLSWSRYALLHTFSLWLSLWHRRSSTSMCVMTLFTLQCPRIEGLLMLVLLLLLLALPIVVVPPPLLLPTPTSWRNVWGIFATCWRTDQRLDVMDQRL